MFSCRLIMNKGNNKNKLDNIKIQAIKSTKEPIKKQNIIIKY